MCSCPYPVLWGTTNVDSPCTGAHRRGTISKGNPPPPNFGAPPMDRPLWSVGVPAASAFAMMIYRSLHRSFRNGWITLADRGGAMVNETAIHEALRETLSDAGPPTAVVGSHWLQEGAHRLDAGHYSSSAAQALRALEGHEVERLSRVARCFILPRFKRVFADSPEFGWPYLSASEALHFRPMPTRWLARAHAPKRGATHFVEEGWILVSASGTVGRPILVGQRLTGWFLTHDLVRVIPSGEVPAGFLYAYLASWVGQTLLVRDQYGSAIKHLEDDHVAALPVPLLPKSDMVRIDRQMQRVTALREDANRLLDEATDELYQELDIPPPPATATGRDDMLAFATPSAGLGGRMDASFHTPQARVAVDVLESGPYRTVELAKLCSRVFYPGRFKRSYVAPEFGVPFIQGSHIPLVNPFGIKHLARADKRNLERCVVGEGWVLVTRSGTLGRVSLVTAATDGSVASEHIIRAVPRGDVNPGYLALFLMTPYGSHQVLAKTYGAVVDELTDDDLGDVRVPNAPGRVQDAIGNKVVQAFEWKDKATQEEAAAVADVEAIL